MKKFGLSIAVSALALAQTPTPEKTAAFEVASIHRANDDGNRSTHSDNGLLRMHNFTLKALIARAYDVDSRQIYGGPSWLDADIYDISAKIPAELARDRLPEMIQSLLAARFQLAVHREPRQISGYQLVVAKKGSRMEPAKTDQQGSRLNGNNTHLTAGNVTMEAFAKDLSGNRDIGELVVDQTGLKGGFNFTLDWMPERPDSKLDAAPDDRPSIFTALEEQLGLKLERAKVPVQAIVIDRAEKPEID